jgi:hypothetical protein
VKPADQELALKPKGELLIVLPELRQPALG